jgi:hypothetical protein
MRVIAFLVLLATSVSALAAPLSFSPETTLELPAAEPASKPIWKMFYPAWRPDTIFGHLRSIARDPDKRVESEFQTPAALTDRVVFWIAVYSQFTSRMRIVHDRRDPGLVYGYIDFSPLYDQMSEMGAAITAARIEKSIQRKLEMAIDEIAGKKVESPLSESDRALLKRFLASRHIDTPRKMHVLAKEVRTQSGQKDAFQEALRRSQLYLPHIERVFNEHGLPRSLAKIPFVESSFNIEAKSRSGAVGIWQFIPRTAKALIHRNNRKLWSDPLSQTHAAARMLLQNRKALPDWGTTVTSYNSGIGRIARTLRKSEARGIADLLDLSDAEGGLGFAGKNYFAEFLAANLVERYQNELLQPAAAPILFEIPGNRIAAREPIACWNYSLKELPRPMIFTFAPTTVRASSVVEASIGPSGDIWPWIKVKLSTISDAMIMALGEFSSLN